MIPICCESNLTSHPCVVDDDRQSDAEEHDQDQTIYRNGKNASEIGFPVDSFRGTKAVQETRSPVIFLGDIILPSIVTVGSEHSDPPLSAFLSSDVDQTPGLPGTSVLSERVVWKCLGCRTVNHKFNRCCGSCQCPRPSHETVRQAKLHQQSVLHEFAREKQAIVDDFEQQVRDMTARHVRQLNTMRAAVVVAEKAAEDAHTAICFRVSGPY